MPYYNLWWHYQWLPYPHNFPDDRQGCSPVLYSSLTHASICYRMLFHSQCTLGPDRKDIDQNIHSERHAHCKCCRLQNEDNARWGKDWDLWQWTRVNTFTSLRYFTDKLKAATLMRKQFYLVSFTTRQSNLIILKAHDSVVRWRKTNFIVC